METDFERHTTADLRRIAADKGFKTIPGEREDLLRLLRDPDALGAAASRLRVVSASGERQSA